MPMASQKMWRADSGASAIEFALVAPVLIVFFFGIIEIAMIAYSSATLQYAVAAASRISRTGEDIPDGQSATQYMRQQILRRASSLLDPQKLEFESLSYASFDKVGQAEPCHDGNCTDYDDINHNGKWDADQGAPGTGSSDQVVLYQVSYPWPILTPVMRQIIGDSDGNFVIHVRLPVRSEPYA